MTHEESWYQNFELLKSYIEEHHHGANKHTDLYNRTRYYRRKMKEGKLPEDKAKVQEEILNLRHMDEHTGGRRKKSDT